MNRHVVSVLAVLALVLAACTGAPGGHSASDSPRSASQPDSASPTSPTDTPPPAWPPQDSPRVSPFTGKRGVPRKPVLAVKIDNVAPARPQTGLALADIVYVEPVEAGLSRFLAIFSSRLPKTVGPVRSARISNIALLRQFGTPALAYSGAHPKLVPLLRKSHLVTLPPSEVPGAYFRKGTREAPHNLYARPKRLLQAASGVSKAHDIGFRFGPPPAGGKRVRHRTVSYGAATVGFTWSNQRDQWLVSTDGSPLRTITGARVSARTVVVQYVDIRPSRFKGPLGYVTPHVETVGSGAAVVLRGGKAYQAHWSRPKRTAGTRFTTRSGERMNFARGTVWVVFEDAADR